MPTRPGWIAGPYRWTYNGRRIGITKDGFVLTATLLGEEITGDNLGRSIQDYVLQGANVFFVGSLNEWDLALNGFDGDAGKTNVNCASIFWPIAALGASGQVGRLASLISAPLVGTPVTGTTAATASIKNLTATYAIVAPNSDVTFALNTSLRDVQGIRLQALPGPTVDYGSQSWFVML